MSKNEERIITTPLEEIMGDRFGRYSKYIIQDRALPDVRDGLKPVQRRILYAMNQEGNTHEHGYRKSAKSVGIIMGNFHPHGDSSIYDAMVRLSQDWKSRIPLIDMQGNNGSIDDDPAAAMRYTEARLAPIAQMMLADIDKDTVTFAPNFDDTEMEPTVLPARYPNLLVNGITGIASGYATNIPPHNLNEVIDACNYRIRHPKCSLEELMEFVKGPDFPTGGIVQGKEGIVEALTTGRGKIIVRGRCEIIKNKTIQQIVCTEIPYDVIKSNIVRKMDEIRINKDIDGIIDVRDESDRNGLKIVIDVKKDANAQLILNYMYKNTDLQISYNYNVVAIVNKRPMQLGLASMLDAFIAHREEVITRRSKYLLDKKEKRCHILEGLIKCISVLDEVIKIIRNSKDKKDAKIRLMDAFDFSEEQAEAIVTLRLYRLTNTDVTALRDEFATLVNEMEDLHDILESNKTLRKVMINELKEVKKLYSSERITTIEDEVEEIKIDKVDMVSNDRIMVSVSEDGYVKHTSLRSYTASGENSLPGIKEGDSLLGYSEVNNLDNLVLFTNTGYYGYVPMYEIDDTKWKDIGIHFGGKVKMQGGEKIKNAFIISDFNTDGYFLCVSKYGQAKRSEVSSYEVSRNNKLMATMSLNDEDELLGTYLVYDTDEIVLTTKNGYVSRYSVDLIPVTTGKSKGVRAMNLEDDEIVSVAILRKEDQLLVINSAGGMKRVKCDEIRVLGRPVKGNLIHRKVKSNPYEVAYTRAVLPNDSFTMMHEEPITITAKEVAIMSKDATYSNALKMSKDAYLMKGITIVEKKEKKVQVTKEEKIEKVENMSFDF